MFEIVQHIADIRIIVRAQTVERLFADALLGLMDVIGLESSSALPATEELRVESVDRTALLVDFLNAALLRSHVKRQRYTAASFATLTETSLVATLSAVEAGDVHEDVKAVTYHEADVRCDADGIWITTLVLDI